MVDIYSGAKIVKSSSLSEIDIFTMKLRDLLLFKDFSRVIKAEFYSLPFLYLIFIIYTVFKKLNLFN